MATIRRTLLGLLGLTALLVPLAHALEVQPPSDRATVLSIGDGDTIRVDQAGRAITVRLACVDAPELAQSPYGQQARRYLQTRLPIGSSVTLVVKATDRYGRTVAEVIGELNFGLALVEDGQAFAYRHYLGQCDAKEYLDAEFRASRHRFGIWQVPGGITRPWDFRHGRRYRPRCRGIGSNGRAEVPLMHGHSSFDTDADGEGCESLR
jgi:endonuclease YncB( thermonuclease family)